MYIETNEIISACRISIAFWGILTGEKQDWQNPGKCVMSWIIATSLGQEMTVLPRELHEKYEQCTKLSSDAEQILSGVDVAAIALFKRYNALGFEVKSLRQQLESFVINVEKYRVEANHSAKGAWINEVDNRHTLIALAGVFNNLEDQLTRQEKRVEKK